MSRIALVLRNQEGKTLFDFTERLVGRIAPLKRRGVLIDSDQISELDFNEECKARFVLSLGCVF
jgi:hypothetical protein